MQLLTDPDTLETSQASALPLVADQPLPLDPFAQAHLHPVFVPLPPPPAIDPFTAWWIAHHPVAVEVIGVSYEHGVGS